MSGPPWPSAARVAPLTRHPAKFTESILDELRMLVRQEQRARGGLIRVLDPFAGVGRIHQIAEAGRIETYGVEIEPEWAACHHRTACRDSIAFMEQENRALYHAVVTSPAYGNRNADHHDAADSSERRSYRHDLGHMPTEGSNATFAWGPQYWMFMGRAYRAMRRVVRPGGLVAINVSDFDRHKERVHTVEWHQGALWGAGFVGELLIPVVTHRFRNGANRDARAEQEVILVFRQPRERRDGLG